MPDKPKPRGGRRTKDASDSTPKSDWSTRLVEVAREFGPDGTIYAIVSVGAFAALFKKVEPVWVCILAAICIGGWLANKLGSAYLEFLKQEQELKRLKQTKGDALIAAQRDKQTELPYRPEQ